jgi:hypothetical protein
MMMQGIKYINEIETVSVIWLIQKD